MAIQKKRNPFSKIFTVTGSVALVAASIVLPACSNTPTEEAEVMDESTELAEEDNVTTEEISDNLSDFLGETVTVRNEVDETVGEYAFFLEEGEFFGGEEILVINASEEGLYLVEGEGTDVQVTGEVRELIIADLETDYGIDLDPELFAEYETQPVIVAQSLALAPDPDDLTEDPEQYYGQRIAVAGEVSTLYATDLMTIDEESLFGGQDLLVINPNATLDFEEDEEVVMTGVLQSFISTEIERDYDLTWDLDLQEEIEAEFENRPVFIADEVYPSAM